MENEIKLTFLAGVQVDNEIYFSAWNMNGLFKYNPQTEQCDFLRIFDGEGEWGLHSEAIHYKNTIWFIPSASERISIVDISTLNITYLELPKSGYRTCEEQVQTLRIKGCYRSDEKFLWLLPHTYKLFVKIDMEKRKIVKEAQWRVNGNVGANGIKVRDKIVIFRYDRSEISVIDENSEELVIKYFEKEKVLYKGIQIIDEWLVFFPLRIKDGILLLNIESNDIKNVKLKDDGQVYDECQTYTEKGEIFIVPYLGNKYIRIHLDNEGSFTTEYKVLDVSQNTYCSKKLIYNNEVWFLPHAIDKPIICYLKREDKLRYRYIKIDREKYIEDNIKLAIKYGLEYSSLAHEKIIKEQPSLLNVFLEFINKENYQINVDINKQIGKYIYNLMD